MSRRVFVKPSQVSAQLALPTNRAARAHNRQVDDKVAGRRIKRTPGRPRKAVPSPHAVTHQARPELAKKQVLHLTLKLRRGLPSLRRHKAFAALTRSFYSYSHGDGFRLVHFSVQHDHVHLIAEADSKAALTAGMQRLNVSLARRLNFVWRALRGWTGRLFKERYHMHILRKPLEVRNALLYVVRNADKHGSVSHNARDPFSSAPYFDGFASGCAHKTPAHLLASATAWLLTSGWWQKYGPLTSATSGRASP